MTKKTIIILIISFTAFVLIIAENNNTFIQDETKYKLDSIKSPDAKSLQYITEKYKIIIDQDLNDTLAYLPQTMTKNTPDGILGNYMTEICLQKYIDSLGGVDFCILNNGGIRSSLDKGYVIKKDIFRLMPFDNELVIVELQISDFYNLIDFLKIRQEPISGLNIPNYDTILKQKTIFKILTSDYLANGGGRMTFLHNKTTIKTGEKLIDLIIDYLQDIKCDTIKYTNKARYE